MTQPQSSFTFPSSPRTPTTPTPSQPGFAAAPPTFPSPFAAQQQGFSPQPGFAPQAGFGFQPSHGRKRGAESPPSPGLNRAPDAKRRRPNLANGFQAMSINTGTDPNAQHSAEWLSGQGAHESASSDDDDGLEPTRPPADGDVAVELLPDAGSPRLKRPRAWQRTSSFSSTSPSEGDYESDATFRVPTRPTPPVQASSVEHPPDTPAQLHGDHGGVHVELLDTPSKRKQATEDGQPRKRRREGMDVDLETLPEGSYGPGWYEPEKDRIIVTSLSSPEGSPTRDPSMSPDSDWERKYEYNRSLSQPGNQGFTISPSLLTHIINAQRDQLIPDGYNPSPERGLVLYRPVGAAGAADPPVVREWSSNQRVPLDTDAHRFEEVDDDEDLMTGSSRTAPMSMDMEGTEGSGWEAGDEAMDVE